MLNQNFSQFSNIVGFIYQKPKKELITWVSIFVLALVGISAFFVYKNFNKPIVGVQLVTSRGSILIGRNKYSKKMILLASRRIGWFNEKGNPQFYFIKHKKEKAADKAWEIVWEWDELYLDGQSAPIAKFTPAQEDKDQAVETLTSMCSSPTESMSCQWNVSHKINLESLTNKFVCISDLSSEFYGGAHPIALRNFRTLNPEKKKFVRFNNFVKDAASREYIWGELDASINDMIKSGFSSAEGSSTGLGGFDSLTPPEGFNQGNSPKNNQDKLNTLLASQGYSFNPNAFCPSVKPNGNFLLFGFPHSEQVNRGLNFRAEVLLNKEKFPISSYDIFREYSRRKSSENNPTESLYSPRDNWKITQDLNEVTVSHDGQKVKFVVPEPQDSDEEILGIFWIYKSPSPSALDKFRFREIKHLQKGVAVDVAAHLNSEAFAAL